MNKSIHSIRKVLCTLLTILAIMPASAYAGTTSNPAGSYTDILSMDKQWALSECSLSFASSIAADESSITGVDDTIKIVPGEFYKLSPKYTDSNGNLVSSAVFSYNSNNPAIASVDQNGSITAVSEGETIININFETKIKQVIVNVDKQLSVKSIAKNIDAVVYIEMSDVNGQVISSGSGFIISSDGTIVTNYHVIDGASFGKVTLENGSKYDVDKVLSANEGHDLAILKLKNASNLPIVRLGNSDKLEPGEEIVAIGSPGGIDFQNTITDGIVSGFRKSFRTAEGVQDIQISASIYSGSSGGALFNMYGEVIGVTYAGSSEMSNVNFAVPINELKLMLNEDIDKTLMNIANPPSKPKGLRIYRNTKEDYYVELYWNQNTESDVAGYYVYESNNPNSGFNRLYATDDGFSVIDLIQDTNVQVMTGETGETQYYYITAVNECGVESPKSETVSITYK